MNYKFIQFLLIVFSCCLLVVPIFSTTEISLTDYTDKLNYSPNNNRYILPGSLCLFKYVIRVDYNSDSPPSISGFTGSSSFSVLNQSTSLKSILYSVIYQFSPPSIGQRDVVPITSPQVSIKTPLSLTYYCNEFNNSLTYKVLQQDTQNKYIRGFAGYFNSLVRINDMPQSLTTTLSDFNISVAAQGFRYLNLNTKGNNIKIVSNYIYFSLALYYRATLVMTPKNMFTVYPSTLSQISISADNNLFNRDGQQTTSPASLDSKTYPTDCLGLQYWHCYNLETYPSSISDKYYFYTFLTNFLGPKNLNFKIWANATHSTYLNIIPATTTKFNFVFAYLNSTKYFTAITNYDNVIYSQGSIFTGSGGTSYAFENFQGLRSSFTSTFGGSIYVSSKTLGQFRRYLKYPFGAISINHVSNTPANTTVAYSFVFPIHLYFTGSVQFSVGFDLLQIGEASSSDYPVSNNIISDNQPPTLFYYDYQDVDVSSFSIIIGASDDRSGLGTMFINLCKGDCIYSIGPSNLIQGNITNGIYKIILPKSYFGIAYATVELTMMDRSGNQRVYKANEVYNDQLEYIKLVPFISPLTISPDQIKELYFDNYNLPNNVVNNITMFIKTDPIIPNYQFMFTPNYGIVYAAQEANNFFHDDSIKSFRSTFNSGTGYHEIKITIPAHLNADQISYLIGPVMYDNVFLFGLVGRNASIIPSFVSPSDIMPPIISKITPSIPNIPQPGQPNTELAITFTIQDDVNGIGSGVITIVSDYNLIGWNLTIYPILNSPLIGEYTIRIPLSSNDRPQQYRIGYVWLIDAQGHVGEWPSETKISPLLKFWNTSALAYSTTTAIDGIVYESTPPTLLNFVAGDIVTSIDGQTKSVDFQVTVGDDSGISATNVPIVYLSSSSLEVIGSTIVNYTIGPQSGAITFGTKVVFPFSFGYPDILALSIYGITDINYNIAGYNTKALKDFTPSIPYFISNTIANGPEIINVIYENQSIKINGQRLGFSTTTLIVKYSSSSSGSKSIPDKLITTFVSFTDTYIESNAIKSTDLDNYIQVAIRTSDGLTSEFKTLKIPGTNNGGGNGGSTNPTTTPKICPGSPVCGGPTKGNCGTDGVTCNCIPPNSGADCSLTNTGTNGTIDPTKPNVGFDYSKDAGIYKSLIVVDSLQEIDFNGKVVKTYPFSDWSFVKIDEDHFQFNTSFQTTSGIDQTTKTTTIIVKIVRYHQATTINFANQNYSIEPNTVKYSIDMDGYKFQSKLNSLHLLMKTSLESNQVDNICSSSQFGDAGDSSFIKIQIDTLVLYGRFLKRGVIDGLVATINQVPVSSSTGESSNSAQSFIAMQIPYYENEINLDPNFSVLVDSRSTSEDDPNAVCSKKSNGLTTAQLIGIIIGGAFFLVVVVILLGIILFRHNTTFRLLYYRLFKKGLKKKVNGH